MLSCSFDRDSLICPIVNVLTSIFAGFVIFSVLGYMATTKGVSVDEVATSGTTIMTLITEIIALIGF